MKKLYKQSFFLAQEIDIDILEKILGIAVEEIPIFFFSHSHTNQQKSCGWYGVKQG